MLPLNFFHFATISALLHLGSPLFSSYFHLKRQLTTSLSLCQTSSSGATATFVHSNLSLETSTITDNASSLSSLAAIEMMCKGIQLSDSLSYEIDRISYNKELQNLLWKGQLLQVTTKLQKLKEQDVKLNVDTVHILISDSFSRKDVSSVELFYRQYFESNLLTPTSRTLNIIMEGYRMLRDETKVFYYRDRFGHFNISMDSYSYSTLIRTARTADSIKAILSVAESGKSLSQPLMRCAIESLGKLGDPFGAVNVASRLSELDSYSNVYRVSPLDDSNRSINYRSRSIFDSIASGDSLLVALLENPQSLLVPSSDDDQQFGERARLTNRSGAEIIVNTSRKWADPTHVTEADSVLQLKASDQCSLAERVEGMRCGEAAIHLILASQVYKDGARSTSPGIYGSENVVSAAATSSHATTGFSKSTQRDVLICGSKGWCRIFTFLQRSIKENLEELELTKDYNNNSKMRSRHEAFKLQSKKLRDIRDQLWLRLLGEILEVEASELADRATANETMTAGVVTGDSTRTLLVAEDSERQESSTGRKTISAPLVSAGGTVTAPTSALQQIAFVPVSFSANSASNSRSRGLVELNGRLSDALLRCYLEDAEKAKKMWKNSILPIAKRLSASSKNTFSFDEICEKSLEALMFVSGYNNRADLGFEIALTVRNRNWNPSARSKLAKSYVQGKVQTKRRETQWLKSNILNDGLERSIESELGVQLVDYYSPDGSSPPPKSRSRQWPQRIRIQFKTEGLSPGV
jgi:hypothetical protein